MFGFTTRKNAISKANNVRAIDKTTYAIGDIHGRYDLLLDVYMKILEDIAKDSDQLSNGSLPRELPRIVFLGDYIDRGNSSKQVIDFLSELHASGGDGKFSEVVCLLGNHERAMMEFLEDSSKGRVWCDYGGFSTLASYGIIIASQMRNEIKWDNIKTELAEKIPDSHRQFILNLHTHAIFGDYYFVHAGIDPNKKPEEQEVDTMLTIRSGFLESKKNLGFTVVHGHTPSEEPEFRNSRIGIDTGAYATNKLTCLKIENGITNIIQT